MTIRAVDALKGARSPLALAKSPSPRRNPASCRCAGATSAGRVTKPNRPDGYGCPRSSFGFRLVRSVRSGTCVCRFGSPDRASRCRNWAVISPRVRTCWTP